MYGNICIIIIRYIIVPVYTEEAEHINIEGSVYISRRVMECLSYSQNIAKIINSVLYSDVFIYGYFPTKVMQTSPPQFCSRCNERCAMY